MAMQADLMPQRQFIDDLLAAAECNRGFAGWRLLVAETEGNCAITSQVGELVATSFREGPYNPQSHCTFSSD